MNESIPVNTPTCVHGKTFLEFCAPCRGFQIVGSERPRAKPENLNSADVASVVAKPEPSVSVSKLEALLKDRWTCADKLESLIDQAKRGGGA